MVAASDFIDVSDLPEYLQKPAVSSGQNGSWRPVPLDTVRQEHIQRVLDLCKGNRVRTAQMLGIGRTSLYRYLKQDNLDRGRDSRPTVMPPSVEVTTNWVAVRPKVYMAMALGGKMPPQPCTDAEAQSANLSRTGGACRETGFEFSDRSLWHRQHWHAV